jgi:hypothetical protein
MNRRMILLGLAGITTAASTVASGSDQPQLATIRIVLSPTCGCCKDWVTHLERHSFSISVEEVPEINRRKTAARIPKEFWSCHTAFVGGYFIEGHVAADDIKRLLVERPAARGLAVPGMPVGSPGMEMPNVPADRYKTLMVTLDDRAIVWAEH